MINLKMSAAALAVMCAFSAQTFAMAPEHGAEVEFNTDSGGENFFNWKFNINENTGVPTDGIGKITVNVNTAPVDGKAWLIFSVAANGEKPSFKDVTNELNIKTNATFDEHIKFQYARLADGAKGKAVVNIDKDVTLTSNLINQDPGILNVGGSIQPVLPPDHLYVANGNITTVNVNGTWIGSLVTGGNLAKYSNNNTVNLTAGAEWTGAVQTKNGDVTNVNLEKGSRWNVDADSTVDKLMSNGLVDIKTDNATLTIKDDSVVDNMKSTKGKVVVEKQLTFTGMSDVGDLTSTNGQINIDNTSLQMSGKADVANMSFIGYSDIHLISGADVTIGHAKGGMNAHFDAHDLSSAALNVQNADGCVLLTVNAEAAQDQTADQLVGALNNSYTGVDAVFDISRGDIIDSIVGTFHGDQAAYSEKKNDNVLSLDQMTAMTMMQWRSEADDMNQRMGELRNGTAINGAWVRTYGGKAESMWAENEYNGLQVGMDRNINDGDMGHWVGVALSYTDGDGKYTAGTSDNYTFAFTGYSTWLTQTGSYLDLSAKFGKLHDDFDFGAIKGAYSTQAMALSAEMGHRYPLMETFFVEPQLAFTYAHIFSEDYKATKCIGVSQDSIDSYVARAGLMTGIQLPENKGSMWVRASYLYDFDGESTTLVSRAAEKNVAKQDFGGGWYELGLGATMNITPNFFGYADFEYVAGGEIDTPYRWNVGVRYSF